MRKNLLITGGLGNLGSWLTDYFCRQNYHVFVLASRKRPILQELDFTFISCDITDLAQIREKLSATAFDFVIHTASVNDFFLDNFARDALLVNALGTRNLLEYFKDKNLEHFVYFSTFQVYGKRSGVITEETPAVPTNDYGSTHLFAEHYIRQFYANAKTPYSILRLTNSYGCPKDPDSSKWYLVLNDLSRMAAGQGEIVLKSNGQATRDFIWMGDVCSIVHQLLEIAPTNDTYNVCREKTYSMLEIAHFVQEAYEEMYGEKIPVRINEEDKTQYPDDLAVKAHKLKQIIEYSLSNKFKEEAKKIFKTIS